MMALMLDNPRLSSGNIIDQNIRVMQVLPCPVPDGRGSDSLIAGQRFCRLLKTAQSNRPGRRDESRRGTLRACATTVAGGLLFQSTAGWRGSMRVRYGKCRGMREVRFWKWCDWGCCSATRAHRQGRPALPPPQAPLYRWERPSAKKITWLRGAQPAAKRLVWQRLRKAA